MAFLSKLFGKKPSKAGSWETWLERSTLGTIHTGSSGDREYPPMPMDFDYLGTDVGGLYLTYSRTEHDASKEYSDYWKVLSVALRRERENSKGQPVSSYMKVLSQRVQVHLKAGGFPGVLTVEVSYERPRASGRYSDGQEISDEEAVYAVARSLVQVLTADRVPRSQAILYVTQAMENSTGWILSGPKLELLLNVEWGGLSYDSNERGRRKMRSDAMMAQRSGEAVERILRGARK